MRGSRIIQLAGAAAVAALPVTTTAAPLRAGAALPAAGAVAPLSAAAPQRAASPNAQQSGLIGFPIAAVIGLFLGLVVIIVATSGNGRSPG